MKLTDVDALLKSHCIALNGEYESCAECLGTPYGCCCLEIKGEDIYAAPTIYAIPVEWLINRANDPERAPLYRRYAQMLYEEWQKEQEAQEVKEDT